MEYQSNGREQLELPRLHKLTAVARVLKKEHEAEKAARRAK